MLVSEHRLMAGLVRKAPVATRSAKFCIGSSSFSWEEERVGRDHILRNHNRGQSGREWYIEELESCGYIHTQGEEGIFKMKKQSSFIPAVYFKFTKFNPMFRSPYAVFEEYQMIMKGKKILRALFRVVFCIQYPQMLISGSCQNDFRKKNNVI